MFEFHLPAGLLEGDPPAWYAVVRHHEFHPPHYDGKPRAATDGAQPRILIMEPGGESDVFVSLYAEDFGDLTDLWFPSREEAVQGCEDTVGDELGAWQPIPHGESRPESFVLHRLSPG